MSSHAYDRENNIDNLRINRDFVSEGCRSTLLPLLETSSVMTFISVVEYLPPMPSPSTYESVYKGSIDSNVIDFMARRTNPLEMVSEDVLKLGIATSLNLPHEPAAATSPTTTSRPIITSYYGGGPMNQNRVGPVSICKKAPQTM